MKEKPIIFKDCEIRAIKDNRKSQFRRIVKPQPLHDGGRTPRVNYDDHGSVMSIGDSEKRIACPYEVGSQLWVKETWCTSAYCDDRAPSDMERPGKGYGWLVFYPADDSVWWRGSQTGGPGFINPGKRRSPIHMPRWASRITLEVTRVRVERLQAITWEDAVAEGCTGYRPTQDEPTDEYRRLWEADHGPGSWNANPWVWVIEFKREGGAR